MLGWVTNLGVYLNPVPELQGEPEDISRDKARLAAREVSFKLCFSNCNVSSSQFSGVKVFPIAMFLLHNFRS